jgi:NADH-ubiquinone oxidoreductase chain 6
MLLHILNEISFGYSHLFLTYCFLLAVLFGVLVLVSKNPIISIVFLIGLFISISCYLLLVGAGFIGISYLVVYIGAVSILFLFILMLINIRISELVTDTRNSIPLSILTCILFGISVYEPVSNDSKLNFNNIIIIIKEFVLSKKDTNSWFVSSSGWDESLVDFSHIMSIGSIMYTNFALWLILTTMVLLLSMIGAISLTFKNIDLTSNELNNDSNESSTTLGLYKKDYNNPEIK